MMNLRGTSKKDFNQFKWQEVDEMESLFNVSQYIAQINQAPNTINRFQCPSSVDDLVWIYEYLRYFCVQLNYLVPDIEVCQCDAMVAGEWKFLCSAHASPVECSALDYIIHTLDGTTALLNSSKIFPSRVAIDKDAAVYFSNVSRRLYRIFAHVYYHHFDLWDVFKHTHDDFVALCECFQLVSKEALIVPYGQKTIPVTMERTSILE